MTSKVKIAIVYDWIDKWGGVERALLLLHEMFPQADFYSSYFHKNNAKWANKLNIKTSFIQSLPNLVKNNRLLSLLFYPYAFEIFNFNKYDVVISVSSGYAKSIITRPGTYHINYMLTPTRYLWVYPDLYFKPWQFLFISSLIRRLKHWDKIVSNRPDKIISISKTVSERCGLYYNRESSVIYPPFDMDYWIQIKKNIQNIKRQSPEKYYLVVSRLEKYKKIDLVIDVFNKLPDKKLIIVGEGSGRTGLRLRAKSNIKFVYAISDEELGKLYQRAEALIMPQNEDFGLVSLEAQFFGCPVIAYGKGGAMETVIADKTGIFFDTQSKTSLKDALERFQGMSYNLKISVLSLGVGQCNQFNLHSFKSKFIHEVYLKNQ